MRQRNSLTSPFNIIVIVAALGYFVDIYDLILFQVIKTPSLQALGLTGQELTDAGLTLMNWQMIGMLIGGIVWGVLGDKKGRVSVLFGSILMYSLANIANAFVHDLTTYAVLRLVAGIGLAGELGAGITLVSETMTQRHRGYGTMIVVSFGVLGAVAANLVALNDAWFAEVFYQTTGKQFAGWQIAYIIGGVLGILLLIMRMGAYESHMYVSLETDKVVRGSFLSIFKTGERLMRYVYCIAIGIPIWYMIGVLIALARDISAAKGLGDVVTGNAVMYFYLGTAFGDFLSGYMSQVFRSRKKIVLFYLLVTVIAVPYYLYNRVTDPSVFYWICAFLGFAAGYWAVFVTIASEQFGTNIRSTVTTTVPNFVRGSLVLLTLLLTFLQKSLHIEIITACLIVGIVSVSIAFWALSKLKETYHKDLNYTEMM